MELILQQGLPHQQKAIDAVCGALDGVRITPPAQFFENPQIDLEDERLAANLRVLQQSVPEEYRNSPPAGGCLNLDIKMETGTGKTYVYTKTIYELHKRWGINKFIIAVPSLAVKAGAAQFMQDEYSRRHFTDACGYGTEIELGVLEAPKSKKKGRGYFPGVVSDFIKGSCQNTRKIYVLLVNMQLLTSNSKRGGRDTGLLWRDDYDYGAEGFYRPLDALRATKPVVIIDEPHRFSRDQKAFQVIMDEIRPQCVIRYGATFPEITVGRGKDRFAKKDYQNLLYDLNACESFSQGLIKCVAKEHFLSFRNADGSCNTLRFLFSKWTLKEGWDNPNVFTIAKLRSSGSDNSKLQEVGRGLRLPVDENGNRVSNEEFQLNYIVDFTEADFARRLTDQINGEIPQASVISEERLAQAAQTLGKTADELFDELYGKQYIDRHNRIRPETRARFFEEYPAFASGLPAGKVKDRNREQTKPVKIRKAVYEEMREFWERINRRYLLFYDSDLNGSLEETVLSLFEKPGVFTDVVLRSSREIVHSDGTQMSAAAGTGVQYTITRPIPYGTFLTRIMRATSIPLATLHRAMTAYSQKHGTIGADYINENSAGAFCAEFQNWKVTQLQGRFRYVKSQAPCGATALTYADGSPREEIAQGRIGTKIVPGTPGEKYLYDTFAYDSPLEKSNLTAGIEEVVVYGKIPRNSVAIPTVTGGMYSPDFMYVVKKASGEKELNIVVETKDVEGKDALRGAEAAKIECARVFFDTLSQEGYTVHFREQISNQQMAQIIGEILHAS